MRRRNLLTPEVTSSRVSKGLTIPTVEGNRSGLSQEEEVLHTCTRRANLDRNLFGLAQELRDSGKIV